MFDFPPPQVAVTINEMEGMVTKLLLFVVVHQLVLIPFMRILNLMSSVQQDAWLTTPGSFFSNLPLLTTRTFTMIWIFA